MSKIIGILGGMGPAATVDLFQKIVVNTHVKSDQEHPPIFIYNNSKIPSDRKSKKTLNELIKSAIILENAGVDFIIMPCNSAHIWEEQIKAAITIPFYSMIDNTIETILRQNNHTNSKFLLLATETTINYGLYQKVSTNTSHEIITPVVKEQNIINKAIKSVKAGKLANNPYINDLNIILESYKDKGISTLISGCTEIPLLFQYFKVDMEMIDPTLLLAKLSVQKAIY